MLCKEENTAPIVEVEHLNSGYEDQQVLKDITILAPEHKITIIQGASGCGKTTLLKHLIRLLQPWSGSIKLFGQDITNLDEPDFNIILKKIGVLFQNGALLGSLTVCENVAIPLEQHTTLDDQLIRKLVEMKLNLVGLAHAIDRFPSELSGGMRKRAAVARAIALDPPLLFGDEPSAGLDPVTSAGLDELILKMRDQLGMTVVLVSHEVASINRIADRVIFLDDGEVLFCGPIQEAKSAGIEKIDDFFAKG